jgi:N-acetyl-D-muramate 6-phosphate phosphatase
MTISAVFFDLDGTLLDTAPDILAALQDVSIYFSLPSPPCLGSMRSYVGQGTAALITHALDIPTSHPSFNKINAALLATYQKRHHQSTIFFQGIAHLLRQLTENAIPWGIVTSKPGWLARPLLQVHDLIRPAACIITRETLIAYKPDPAPLQYAQSHVSQAKQDCLYVGDTHGDHLAAKTSGMQSAILTWGYHKPTENPAYWHPDYLITKTSELANLIFHNGKKQ